jgi:hypothetical protein
MFQLSKDELENWRSQIVMFNPTSKMGLRRPPYAFTELGVAMLSSVLKSERAVHMNILIMRAFVRLREILATDKDLARAIEDLSRRQDEQGEQITPSSKPSISFYYPSQCQRSAALDLMLARKVVARLESFPPVLRSCDTYQK